MKKKIILGSLLVIFFMAMLPSANAVGFSAVKEIIKSQPRIINQDININDLKIKIQDGPEPTIFFIFIIKQILNVLRIVKFGLPIFIIYSILFGE